MLTLLLLAVIVIPILILRALLRPLRYARRGYSFSPYGCHHHRRGRLMGSFLPILLLVALERFTTRRY